MELPEGALLREISPWYNQRTVPRTLLSPAPAPDGLWAKVVVESGRVEVAMEQSGVEAATPEASVVVPPAVAFQINPPIGDVRFHIHYLAPPKAADADDLAGLLSRS